ncbi:MAG: hypothetical protein KDB37_18510, partial [Ilumatobacter sp.]|nr:hypothetical protein [Ilumatobacter sp.]
MAADHGRARIRRAARRTLMIGVALTALASGLTPRSASAQDGDERTPDQELVDRYAPVVMIKQQDGPCDTDGEPFEPAPVEIVLDNRE